ncbi:hypothetical protein M3Y96_00048000 [Aphelenchoides besseyi]|nr:hypothetical protein M3Y96_00048000 [Aphelenchoides besseyi]
MRRLRDFKSGVLLLIFVLSTVSDVVAQNNDQKPIEIKQHDSHVHTRNADDDSMATIDTSGVDVSDALFLNEPKRNAPGDDLWSLYDELDSIELCNRTLDTPLLRHLLNHSATRLEQQDGGSRLLFLAQLIARHTYLATPTMPLNASLTGTPLARPMGKSPLYVLEATCEDSKIRWTPVAIYPTSVANSFLQLRLPQLEIDACRDLSQCPNSKCSWTSHGNLRVYARSCCDSETRFCRADWRGIHTAFYALSVVFALGSFLMIFVVYRERRRQQQESRGWALMELFFVGAGILYSQPLIDWIEPSNGCVLAVWMREVGFTLFYGSVVLKIYRNLQEYRVRKAHHVIVREQDLLKYLACGMAITLTSLVFWTLGSLKTDELFDSQWPQCPFQKWSIAWSIFELVVLLYGIRLCYKARSSNWVERYQFTAAVALEMIVNLAAQVARYSLRHTGSSDLLFIIAVVQLHFTVTVNIVAIITPKFILVTDTNRRTLIAGTNNSGRAHPSLAKLRDNLINGTIDFAEVPIIDMNPDDIRAELKRVYTQLRMYKVKNIYQENPHISKRKGGKKVSDKTNKNRRISIPPVKRVDEEEEKSDLTDLTVESALQNRLFLSANKIQEANEQGIRV